MSKKGEKSKEGLWSMIRKLNIIYADKAKKAKEAIKKATKGDK